MSSPAADPVASLRPEDEDDPMHGSGGEEEGEGEGVAPGVSDDSSEEPEEDEEEERRIREGFIVDEDEEEEDDDEEERKRRRKKRRRHRREREEEEGLEEDDLDLLEENTGASFKHRLTRLRRAPGSTSAPSSSKRKAVVESSDDDLDNDDLELPKVQDIHNIWDDERGAGREDEDDADMDDLDNFIDDDDDDEPGAAMDEDEREERRRQRRRLEKERRKAMGSRPELSGIDANAWDEIYEVFGDGHDYDWALAEDEEAPVDDDPTKLEMKYQDVFEPSEIKARMLTEDDDLIRAHDIPERMQLANSSLSQSSTLTLQESLTENDLDDAASWVITRLSPDKEKDFFRSDGIHHRFLSELVQAITYALRFLFIQEFEVPYIWVHKRDYITYFNPNDLETKVDLLSLDDLWRIYTVGKKYRSLVDRRKALDSLYARLGASDEYYESEIRKRVESVEMVADATEWLGMKYRDEKKLKFDMSFHDDEESQETKHWKMPSRVSAYEMTKKSIISKLAQGFGIQPHEVVLNFLSQSTTRFLQDQDLSPLAYAEQFVDSDPTKALSSEELLRRARMILATELGKDPLLRQDMRNVFKSEALVSVLPTDRGISKIDEHHKYFNFKYLHEKRVVNMLHSEQFLYILEAEAQHLVNVSITLPSHVRGTFERRLSDAFASDSYSDTARAWNEERLRVVQETLQQHLIPNAIKWTREWIREEAEEALCKKCADTLRARIDVAPYINGELQPGDTSSVLALSWGKGDPHKDPIAIVFLDEAGRLREHTRIDNLSDIENVDEFKDILKRRQPNVIVIGGFSVATYRLQQRVKELLDPPREGADGWSAPQDRESFSIPVIYVHDEVARIYQHSKRAAEEFSALTSITKYCIGLARYVQSPLNEFAALGSDITAINLHEYSDDEYQQLIPKEKLLTALERVLVDVTNKVGVDINRAVTDSYYQHLLPFVCGLGPRKAQLLVKKIAAMGGTLMNRDQFIRNGLLTTKIFLNAAGFLKITQDSSFTKPSKNRHNEDSDSADPLDSTRIHPEDYELARKMATDAQDLDEEDHHGDHPSAVISGLLGLPDKERRLNVLNLDDFAVSMYETNQDRKRHTLNVIRAELLKPFEEIRSTFLLPDEWDVVTMLTGETPKTLKIGLIVSVMVTRVKPGVAFVRLDSGIEGVINKGYLSDTGSEADKVAKKGQIISAVIINIKPEPQTNSFTVDLSARDSELDAGDSQFRRVKPDDAWNHAQHDRDIDMQARKKRAEVDKSRRVIKHPNFHNFNSSQAEAYLEKQQRGDVVIRPSSKGANHLAVTWKVEDGLYQHIDVVDADADPTGQTVGGRLVVDATHQYSDLDELIVNHVQAMNRKVEDLMMHEKFKPGDVEELHLFLKNFVAANPSKSAYGFSMNRKKPGHFWLCFLANKNSDVQKWPVRVTPEAYYLFETPAAGVPELCDAFKVRHLHESQAGGGGGGIGGKTPYGGRTPARTPGPGASVSGHQTPGRMSVRNSLPSRTPNPYGGGSSSAGLGGVTPYGAGYQTPGHPSRSSRPIAQDSGAWGGSGKW